MLRVGLIGIGFMGWIHYLAYQRSSAAKLAAIATRDAKKKAGDWTSIKGNFGPPGAVVDLSSVEKFDDWRDMIQSPNIDAVDICLPPAMHAEVSLAALEAGKHVLCEKPIALNAADARAMTEAAKANQRVLNIAHVLPFMGAFKYALELCKSGQFGNVRSVVLKRIISDPTWIPDFYNPKTVGGPMVDLHIHDAHFIQLLCGKPKSVTAGGWTRGDVVEYAQMLYRFEQSGVVASASSAYVPLRRECLRMDLRSNLNVLRCVMSLRLTPMDRVRLVRCCMVRTGRPKRLACHSRTRSMLSLVKSIPLLVRRRVNLLSIARCRQNWR